MAQPTLQDDLVEKIILIFATEFLDFHTFGPAHVATLAVVHSSWTPWVRRLLLTSIQITYNGPLGCLLTHLRASPSHSTADLVTSISLDRVSLPSLHALLPLVKRNRAWSASPFVGHDLPHLRSLSYSHHPLDEDDNGPNLRGLFEGIASISSLQHLDLSNVEGEAASTLSVPPNSPVLPATFALKSLQLEDVYISGLDLPLFLAHSTSSLVDIWLNLPRDGDGVGARLRFSRLVAQQAPILQHLFLRTNEGQGLDTILPLTPSFPSLLDLTLNSRGVTNPWGRDSHLLPLSITSLLAPLLQTLALGNAFEEDDEPFVKSLQSFLEGRTLPPSSVLSWTRAGRMPAMSARMEKVVEVGKKAGVKVQLGYPVNPVRRSFGRGWIGTEELLRERRSWPSEIGTAEHAT